MTLDEEIDYEAFNDKDDDIDDFNTIEDTIINFLDNPIAYDSLSLINQLRYDDHILNVPEDNIIYQYMEELTNASFLMRLPSEYQKLFRFRPELLSYYLYGSIEYDYIILALNNMISPKTFDLEVVRIVSAEYLEELISLIADTESDWLEMNRKDLQVT